MTYSEIISIRLQQLCEQEGITINRLATRAGITQSTVENIMNGQTRNPTLKTLCNLASGLEMTVSQLLDFPEINELQIEED